MSACPVDEQDVAGISKIYTNECMYEQMYEREREAIKNCFIGSHQPQMAQLVPDDSLPFSKTCFCLHNRDILSPGYVPPPSVVSTSDEAQSISYLERVGEVSVVVVKPEGKTSQNCCVNLRRVLVPLLLRVVLEDLEKGSQSK